MEKNPRSARLIVPGRSSLIRLSARACSLMPDESTRAVRTHRVPQATNATIRACGNRPPAGVVNAAHISFVSARSNTVPSIAVTNKPNAYDSAPAAGITCAEAVNTSRSAAALTRTRAFDTAAAVGVPSTHVRGIREVTRAVTTAVLSRRNRHNPSTIMVVTTPVNTRRRVSTCPTAASACPITRGSTSTDHSRPVTCSSNTPNPAGPAITAARSTPRSSTGCCTVRAGTMAESATEAPDQTCGSR
jgi:hypothetical protein